jgi:hypothetical protein
MKHKILPAAAFVLLAILTTASAWADGGCRTARTATFATSQTRVSATTGGAASPESPFVVDGPVWLTSGCCAQCLSAENDCLAACPPPGAGGHVICVSRCYGAYGTCSGSCGGC